MYKIPTRGGSIVSSRPIILYSYFMPVCSIVKTITSRCRGRPDALLYEVRPSAIVHQVVHGTEG